MSQSGMNFFIISQVFIVNYAIQWVKLGIVVRVIKYKEKRFFYDFFFQNLGGGV